MSTGGWEGPGSVVHSYQMTIATANTPEISAGTTSFTVSSRKKAAVPKAASTVGQLGPGICTKY